MPSVVKNRIFVGFASDLFQSQTPDKKQKLYDVELVKRDLLNQFYTRQGERVMLPLFGSIAWNMIFEPNLASNIELIKNDCIRIVNSDPRVSLTNINVSIYDYGILIQMELMFINFNTADVLSVAFNKENDATYNGPVGQT